MLSIDKVEELINLGLIKGDQHNGLYLDAENHYPNLASDAINCVHSYASRSNDEIPEDKRKESSADTMAALLIHDIRFKKYVREFSRVDINREKDLYDNIRNWFARYAVHHNYN